MDTATHPYCRCLFYSANALARTLTRLTEDAFAETGLAPSLAFVQMAVNRQPGVQPGEIAQIMMLSPSTVTRLVDKLEAKGLVRRKSQGKTSSILPTAAGKRLGSSLQKAWQNVSSDYTKVLGVAASKQLTEEVWSAAVALEAT